MQKTFEVTGPVELDVQLAAGEIRVETGEGPAEVDLIAGDAAAQQLIDAARVELVGGGERPRLVVDVPLRRGGFSFGGSSGSIDCRIRVPEGSTLRSRTKSADLAVRGALAGVEASTASGEVELEQVDGPLEVKSASGDVTAGHVAGRAAVQTASGDVTLAAVDGEVRVHSASGDVSLGPAGSHVSVNTVSGDQEHASVVQGRVAAHSVSGDVRIGVRRGSRVYLDCTTVSGETSSELEVSSEEPDGEGPLVEIRAKTVSGDIVIARASEVHA